MINIVGINKADLIHTIEMETGSRFYSIGIFNPTSPRSGVLCAVIKGNYVVLDLHADDGFDESSLDKVMGYGFSQRVVNSLRLRKEMNRS